MSKRGAPKLPRITELQVLQLVKAGHYRVDLQTGEVTGPMGKVITPFWDRGRAFVRIYGLGGVRTIARGRLVWIAGMGEVPPKGWEVDHDNDNKADDRFQNLICYHPRDHRKKHANRECEVVPF